LYCLNTGVLITTTGESVNAVVFFDEKTAAFASLANRASCGHPVVLNTRVLSVAPVNIKLSQLDEKPNGLIVFNNTVD
jgi:hypothetical protein